jgi:hypothetical protein
MKEKLIKIWKDPVGSNVIAFFIITLLLSLLGAVITLINGLYNKIPIIKIIQGIAETFTLKTEVPIWVVVLFIGICLTTVYQALRKVYNEYTKTPDVEKEEQGELPIFHYGNSINFFANRIGYAFPGLRHKLEWYHGKDAVSRLTRLLSKPLEFKSLDGEGRINPIWWFRAGSSMFVEKFKVISGKKCLMNHDELIINKIAVYQSQFEFQNFLYVETLPDKPSGAYDYYTKNYIEERKKEYGHCSEEFGLINGIAIKREEYEDGAANVKGKVIDTHGAELRTRNLTTYNFIITSTGSPYNSREFDRHSGEIMNGILKGEKEFNELLDFLMTFERKEKYLD